MNSTHSTADLGHLLGIADMEPAEQELMLSRIGELIMESVMIRAVSEMTDEEAEAFSREVALCTDANAIAHVLHTRVPHVDDLITEEALAFRDECADMLGRLALDANVSS